MLASGAIAEVAFSSLQTVTTEVDNSVPAVVSRVSWEGDR